MADERETFLAPADIEAAVRKRKLSTWGGAAAGVTGLLSGAYAGLALENLGVASVCFLLACLGFGIAHPDQVARILGRGRGGGE